MKILTNQAEDVDSKHPTANNSAVSTESVSEGNIPDRDGGKERAHGFSKSLAEINDADGQTLGANAATVLRYLAYRLRLHGKMVAGKRWVRINLDHISEQYCYLGRSTVDDNIARLVKFGCCETHNLNSSHFNRPKYDRTRCYHVPREWMDAAERDLRYFDPSVAGQVGVAAAAIYSNFRFWIGECVSKGVGKRVRLSPSALAGLQPFSLSTIRRALKTLEDEGLIQSWQKKKCWWVPGSRMIGSKPDAVASKADKNASNPDEIVSNPNNDIYCKNLNSSLEDGSKVKPAASPSEPCLDANDNDLISLCYSASHLDEVHQNNGFLAASLPSSVHGDFRHTVLQLAASFLDSQTEKIIEAWNEIEDRDALFDTIIEDYRAFFDSTCKSSAPDVVPILFFGSLETVIGAFMWKKSRNHGYSHGAAFLQPTSYDLQLGIWETLETIKQRRVEQEFAEWRAFYASPDADKESDACLSPAEKMRVFRNAIDSRNKVGLIFYDQIHRTDFVEVTKTALKRIEQLFEYNPDLSPAELLSIFDKCSAAYCNEPRPPEAFRKNTMWHVRHGGRSLGCFAKYMKAIVRQLELRQCPVNVFLGEIKQHRIQQLQAA